MTILTNTIFNADCLKVLPMLKDESVSFILTDPPYITRYRSRDGRVVPNDDNDAWLKPARAVTGWAEGSAVRLESRL